MIKIMLGDWFTLPRVGSDVFSRLMRQARLHYDREKRKFRVEDDTNIGTLLAILKEALDDEIIIELPCFVCGKSAGCAECQYVDVCDRTMVSNRCVCEECFKKEDAYENYCSAFLEKLEAAKVKI